MLSQETINQVKSNADIIAIISEYVPLKKRGRNYIGLCPFHAEKTPSFTVSPDKQIWHCFGCHESGNLITFIQKIDNLNFVEAVTFIANRMGIKIIEDNKPQYISAEEKEFNQIRDILFQSRQYFEESLKKNKPAQNYLSQRKITDRSIKDFHIGYAPGTYDLLKELEKNGFEKELILKSGIAYQDDSGQVELRFRNRIIFPIIDYQGRTIGFGGRVFQEESANYAKYVNSEESLFFNKRKILFGLNLAKRTIQEKESVILMEGYMDVIMAHQFGFKNTVATMGTALTQEHIQKLMRFTKTFYLALDSDEAGQKAIERSLELLTKYDIKVFIVHYTEKDPADCLIQHGSDEFAKAITQAKSMLDHQYELAQQKYGIHTIESRSTIINEMIPFLKKEQDTIVKNYYIKRISRDLGVELEFIVARLKKIDNIGRVKQFIPVQKTKDKYFKAQEELLYLITTDLEIRSVIGKNLDQDDFLDERAKKIYTQALNCDLINQDFLNSLTEKGDQLFLSEILIKGEEEKNSRLAFQDYINLLKDYHRNQKIMSLKNQLKELEKQENQEEKITKLLQEMNILYKNPV